MIDIQPTLNDKQVFDFIHNGYIILESIIAEEFNSECQALPPGHLTDFIQSNSFRQNVLLHSKVAGVARSLLGQDFTVPTSAHNHLYEHPHQGQTLHSDGLTESGYGITHLQCYYYPQTVEIEDGPTMVVPGSHQRLVDREAIAHYGNIAGQISLTVPAGTVVMTHYGIWHKAGPKINQKRRSMIKFSFFRTQPPTRDWVIESGELPTYQHSGRHRYVTEVESYRDRRRGEHTWNWLCGLTNYQEEYHPARMFASVSGIPLSQIQL